MKNKIQASTLIEVVVAMTITMICFVIVSIFINQFLKINNTYTKVKGYILLEEEIINTKKNQSYFDETVEYKNLKFKRNIYTYNNSEDLVVIHYQVLDFKKKLILEKKEIVPLEE